MTLDFDGRLFAGWIFRPRKGTTQIFVPVTFGETDVSGWVMTFNPRPDDTGWSAMEIRAESISVAELARCELLEWNRLTDILNANLSEFERQVRSRFHNSSAGGGD